jgi:hypothetical protein
VLEDEGGVVPDPADQRGAAGVLVLHAEEVQARGAGDAALVDRRALGVQDGGVYPGVVGAEARCPDDRLDVELGAVLEADRVLAGAGRAARSPAAAVPALAGGQPATKARGRVPGMSFPAFPGNSGAVALNRAMPRK